MLIYSEIGEIIPIDILEGGVGEVGVELVKLGVIVQIEVLLVFHQYLYILDSLYILCNHYKCT